MESEDIIAQALGEKYEIQSVIGKGGMAEVYKAIQINLNRPVALKVIHQNLSGDKELICRFLREARICALLNHPNIVTIYDIGSAGSVHYMSMEYLDGITLHDLIRKKGFLSVEEASSIIICIAETLDFIHRKGIVHMDVKSSNIFITGAGRVVLMDFGIVLSEDRDPVNESTAILGTPEYMSPEHIEGKLKIDRRSDIYSLGVVMFEGLTGTLPFVSDNYLSTLNKVLNDQHPSITSINNSVPKWLSSIVSSCLMKDRSQRMPDGQTLSVAIKKKETIKLTAVSNNQLTRKISKEELTILKQAPPLNPVKREKKKFLFSAVITLSIIIGIAGILLINSLTLNISSSAGGGAQAGITTGTPDENKIAIPPANHDSSNIGDLKDSNISESIESETKLKFKNLINSGDIASEAGNYSGAIDRYNEARILNIDNEIVLKKIDTTKAIWVKHELKKRGEERARQLGIEMLLVRRASTLYYMGKTEVTQRLWQSIMGLVIRWPF